MNKNPFLPQPSYTPQQPPLPPGPPPPQPTQPDYSAYWAAAAAAHQQQPLVQPPTVGQYNPQWSAPQPQPPRPPAEQSALYANYGYGNQQNNHWQRQQQQQQLHLQQQQYHAAVPPVTQPPPQPPAQPGYNPYQPTAGYPQQYVPQGMPTAPQQMNQTVYPHPQPQQQQQFFPQHIPPQQQQQQQQQPRHHIHHTPPQHMPPAKRQRFDGPNPSRHGPNQHHAPPPPQPQFQAPPPPAQNMGPFTGPGRGGPPAMNHMPMGGGRGGPGGRGGSIAGGRGGRGAPMTGARGGISGRGRGGGSGYIGGGGGGGGRGGGSGNSLRGHGSRGNFGNKDYQNRRGGSFTGGGNYPHQGPSFRGRAGQGSNRGGRHDSGGTSFSSRDGQSSSNFASVGKKDENRRTLTDFKIVGLEIEELLWTWGVLPTTQIKPEVKEEEVEPLDEIMEPSLAPIKEEPIKEETMDEDTSLKPGMEGGPQLQPENVGEPEVPPNPASPTVEPTVVVPDVPQASTVPHAAPEMSAHTPPPSRIRIYFHTPVTADDSRPIPHNAPPAFTFGATPSDSRKGKRKKLEDDDGEVEEGRARPPPPQGSGMSDDRSSVAASVAPSVAETASEADWLMAAITEGEEEAEAEGELTHGRDRDDDDDGDQLRVSQIVEANDNDSNADADGDADNATVTDGNRVDDVDVDMWAADSVPHEAEKITDGVPLENGATPPADGVDISSLDVTPTETAIVEVRAAGDAGAGVDPAPGITVQLDEVILTSDNDLSITSESVASTSALHEPSVSDSIASSQNDSSVEERSADHIGLPDAQISLSPPRVVGIVKTLQATSAEPTLLDVDVPTAPSSQDDDVTIVNGQHTDDQASQDAQVGDTEATQIDHLPEPPASPPLSNTLLSTASTSTFGDSPTTTAKSEAKTGRTPSANRLSISYAGGNRRLVVDAEIVETLKLFRQEGRIEVVLSVSKEGEDGLKGILLEGLSDLTKSYLPLQIICDEAESDSTLPPFSKVTIPSSLTLRVYLDTEKPLSEPKWAKSGDIQEWLKTMFGRMFWVAGEAAEGWEKKIHVVDPDPPPTIWTVLDGWATNSPAGAPNERQRFLKTHMTETDNILEILLRLVRGERATASYQSTPAISAPSVSGPLLSALSQGSAHGSQQTHVSLAVLALFRMSVEYAKKALGDKGKVEVEERVGEIIRCLPSHLVYKSLDGIFKEWKVEKKGR